jgi:hypothetical protein
MLNHSDGSSPILSLYLALTFQTKECTPEENYLLPVQLLIASPKTGTAFHQRHQ